VIIDRGVLHCAATILGFGNLAADAKISPMSPALVNIISFCRTYDKSHRRFSCQTQQAELRRRQHDTRRDILQRQFSNKDFPEAFSSSWELRRASSQKWRSRLADTALLAIAPVL
jgi:hypothetical protein